MTLAETVIAQDSPHSEISPTKETVMSQAEKGGGKRRGKSIQKIREKSISSRLKKHKPPLSRERSLGENIRKRYGRKAEKKLSPESG